MIGKNSSKHHYLEKKIFIVTLFYSHFNMEDINVADYAHAKRVYKDFETLENIMICMLKAIHYC